MTRKHQRLGFLALGMAALGGATVLVLSAFNDNLVFFYGPSELKAKAVGAGRRVRIGGLVEAHSLSRGADGRSISFRITDGAEDVAVVYQGLVPDLFREEQGAVAEGKVTSRRRLRRIERTGQARRKLHAARGCRRAEEERALAGGRQRAGSDQGRPLTPTLSPRAGRGRDPRGGRVRGSGGRISSQGRMGRQLIFLLPVALFAVLVIAFAVGLRHDPHLLPSALIDRPAPDFALPGLHESANGLTRNDLEGRVTLVNFFASWCAPCREEHTELMALGRLPGVALDGIAYKDEQEAARRFLERLGNPFGHIGVNFQTARPRCDLWGYRCAGNLCRGRQRTHPSSPRRSIDRKKEHVKNEILPLIQQLGRTESLGAGGPGYPTRGLRWRPRRESRAGHTSHKR